MVQKSRLPDVSLTINQQKSYLRVQTNFGARENSSKIRLDEMTLWFLVMKN